MSLDSGAREFVTGTAFVKVHFPVDWQGKQYIRCTMCPFLSSNNRMCQLNKSPVHFPERELGPWCPLEFEEAKKDE